MQNKKIKLSKNQKRIIQEVCSIQFQSLEQILMRVDLGSEWEELWEELEITRKDIDRELIKSYQIFKELKDKPNYILDILSHKIDMAIFRIILYKWSHRWDVKYPNSYKKLWDILYTQQLTHLENFRLS